MPRDIANEIRKLRETTESNRRELLQVELQTCFIAIDRARLEISLHNAAEAEKEFWFVREAEQVMLKLLSKAASPMPEIERMLGELNHEISALWSEINTRNRRENPEKRI